MHDHFFDDLGGHSLLMAQFLNALNARMPEADAAIADVYLEPTVARLAKTIRARGGAQGEARASTVEPVTTVSDWQGCMPMIRWSWRKRPVQPFLVRW